MTTWTEAETPSSESWAGLSATEFESPFTGASEITRDTEQPLETPGEFSETELPFATPFTPETESGDPRAEATAEVLAELGTPELYEALAELAQEASEIHADRLALAAGESIGSGAQLAEQAVREHFEPLAEAAERMLETMAAEAGDREVGAISEAELTQLLETFEAMETPATESPAFEQLFGALKRLAGRAMKAAVGLAKKGFSALGKLVPLKAILRRLLRLVRPLLQRVLRFAIDRLPVPLRPLAYQVKQRLGFELAAEWELAAGEALEAAGTPATGSVAVLAAEFTAEVAQSLLAEAESEAVPEVGYEASAYESSAYESSAYEAEWSAGELWESVGTEVAGEGGVTGDQVDQARLRLITELASLRDGESPGPAFEQFLPAILPVLRLGITIAGRGRVVGFLAGFLAKLLVRFVGPQLSQPLSRAIVSAGLRMLTLEAPTSTEIAQAGPAAIAAVVEDTARRLGELEAEVFEDASRLETETMAAFHEAVARNFPPSLVRPDLAGLESADPGGMWALRPGAYGIKKYTRVLEVTLTPQMAKSITSFGGIRLYDALRASHGITKPMTVKVHLYEAMRGTTLARIAALERRHVPGMTRGSWRYFHPLTVQAASAFGEPGLGKDVDARFVRNRSFIAVGQRFFYLQLPAPRGRVGVCARGTPSQAFLTLDGRPGRNVIRAAIYVSEAEAHEIAARARKGNTTAFVLALRAAFQAAARSITSSPGSRVHVLREAELGEAEGFWSRLGALAREKVAGVVVDVLVRMATDYARVKRDDFVRAVDRSKCGVTVIFTFPATGLDLVLGGHPSGWLGLIRTLASSQVLPAMTTVPGLLRP
jgi:hypothetical protein